MTAQLFEYHARRARQHRLFAQSAASAQVRLSHRQLAAAYWAAAGFVHRRDQARRPA